MPERAEQMLAEVWTAPVGARGLKAHYKELEKRASYSSASQPK